MFRAKLARFYGWSPNVISNLSSGDADMYGKCIEHIQAQENLTLISAYQTVYLDEKKQKEKIKALNKLAYPADEAVKNNKSIFDQIKQAINGR